LTVNGIFDTQTENKLIEYQRKEGFIKWKSL
jgi:peptidoglycan hydrolase-like protein with peptidoglycan-binding domain